MDHADFEASRASSPFEKLPKEIEDLLNRMMLTPTEAMDIEMVTAEEAVQETKVVGLAPKSVEVIVEVPKSPRTPRPKKNKKIMQVVEEACWMVLELDTQA